MFLILTDLLVLNRAVPFACRDHFWHTSTVNIYVKEAGFFACFQRRTVNETASVLHISVATMRPE